VVHQIITDMAVLNVSPEGLTLTEVAPGTTVDQVIAATDAPVRVALNS
jgi:3-oxoacid CoA-transferase subunit B